MMGKEEEQLYRAIGERVRLARENARRTQEELAQEIGLTRTSIANIEKGRQRVQVHTLYAIARVLEGSVNAFLPSAEEVRREDGEDDTENVLLAQLETDERRWVQSVLNGQTPPTQEEKPHGGYGSGHAMKVKVDARAASATSCAAGERMSKGTKNS